MKHFLKGLGLAAGAGALGFAGQHVGDVVSPLYAALITPVIAILAGYVIKSPTQ